MTDFMIGTLEDKPLEIVEHEGVKYFVDRAEKKVYKDEEKLPQVKDKELVKKVLAV